MKFSISEREKLLIKLRTEDVELLVIGGGITGAGIALDAAARGLKVALIEKSDFAFGTSSRSTKLIHGGLRYLKQLEFGLVKEVGSERAVVHKLAPHLVIPEKMLLPLSEKRGLGYWLTSIGLMIYDYLAGVKPADQRRMLTKKKTLKYEPLLKPDDINGGAIYAEYRTDDARLTIEVIKTAFQKGALILNYIKADDFIYEGGKITGVLARDQMSSETFSIRAKAIVSAAGPWVDDLREVNRSKTGKRLHLTKGVHIVVPHHRLPVQQSIYFDVEDGRMIFAIPRAEITYIGTTDTNYTGSLEDVTASTEDALYLLQAVNNTFPKVHLTLDDIESWWAGLRPLIHEDGKSASQLSRKDEIFESASGLISIAGGKLTGYRKMAERIVALVLRKHFRNKVLPKSSTGQIKLTGGPFKSRKQVRRYIASLRAFISENQLPKNTASHLVETYGRQTDEILNLFKNMIDDDPAELKLIKSEILFTINHEMVATVSDFVVRRTGMLYFQFPKLVKYKDEIVSYMGLLLKWPEDRFQVELSEVDRLIATIKSIKA